MQRLISLIARAYNQGLEVEHYDNSVTILRDDSSYSIGYTSRHAASWAYGEELPLTQMFSETERVEVWDFGTDTIYYGISIDEAAALIFHGTVPTNENGLSKGKPVDMPSDYDDCTEEGN